MLPMPDAQLVVTGDLTYTTTLPFDVYSPIAPVPEEADVVLLGWGTASGAPITIFEIGAVPFVGNAVTSTKPGRNSILIFQVTTVEGIHFKSGGMRGLRDQGGQHPHPFWVIPLLGRSRGIGGSDNRRGATFSAMA
jgi:hypothetical protein